MRQKDCLMDKIYECLATQHNPWLVVVAVLMCLGSVKTAFRLYSRACNASRRERTSWLFLTAVATGSGIWATHFIAMLAYEPGLPVSYKPGLTVLSLLIAIAAAGIGFAIASTRGESPRLTRICGGLIVGLGISAMHYTGMAALQVPGYIGWDPAIVTFSLVAGAVFGILALLASGEARSETSLRIGMGLLTVAIVTMHFSAMGAIIITPDPGVAIPAQLISSNYLALMVACISALIVGTGFASAMIDRQLRSEASRRMRFLSDSAIEGLVVTTNGLIVDANASFLSLVDASRDEVIGQRLLGNWLQDVDPAFVNGDETYCETRLRGPSGINTPVEVLRRDMPGHHTGNPGEMTAIYALRDLRERHAAENHIRFLAEHDALTGLLNRATFHANLDSAIERAKREDLVLTILAIDLDRFKELNDIYGHVAGDHALQEVTRRFAKLVSPNIIFGRVGGDEFVALMIHQNKENTRTEARHLATNILDCLTLPVNVNNDHTASLAASIGLACYPEDGVDGETLIFHADLALYRVKSQGGNEMVFFTRDMDDEHRNKRRLSAALRGAIDNQQLSIVYQPQCATNSGEILGFEALLRWNHPELGAVSPARFIPVAEETGFILQLGEWVLRQACIEAAGWSNPLRIAVNISAIQLQQGNLPQVIDAALKESGLAPHRLELELTETALIHNPTRSREVLAQIKMLGVHIAMDDFGTGYSSLATLQSFPFDRIKIDQSFINRVTASSEAAAIVRAVINLGRDLHMQVIAEGVETEEQVAFLLSQSCGEVQGFKYGHPRPIADYTGLITSASDLGAATSARGGATNVVSLTPGQNPGTE
jgi:diguanylate cyclase (GGDEF)-like protein